MRDVVLALISAASLLLIADTANAQWPKGRGRIVGTVLDSATGRPIIRTRICYHPGNNYGICAHPDSTGRYVLDSIAPGAHVVSFQCSAERGLMGRLLRFDTVATRDDEDTRLDVRAASTGCDMRPYREERATFAGHWRFGFEESRFTPCSDSFSGWFDFAPGARSDTIKWPKQNDRFYPTVFLRFEGVVRGPWSYGHGGGSKYQFVAERVIATRDESLTNCR